MNSFSFSLCVGLCVYNSEQGLPYVLSNLDKLRLSGVFGKSDMRFIVVYEDNDSNLSNTHQLLNSFSNLVHPCVVEFIKNKFERSPVRQRHIGNARNTVLERLRELRSSGTEFSHFAFMDTNNYACIGAMNTEVIREAMARSDEWDSLSFLREAGYYDMWALSYDPYIHSFFHFREYWNNTLNKVRAHFDPTIERAVQNGETLFPVFSAYNGFAIYKSSVYLSDALPVLRYSDEIKREYYPEGMLKRQETLLNYIPDDRVDDDCEHRYFHLASLQPPHNARIFIYLKSLFKKMSELERPTRFCPRYLV